MGMGIGFDRTWLMFLPILVVAGFLLIYNYKLLYWLLIASIPFSITKDFNQRLSTDFPTEFICIGLTAIFWAKFFIHKPQNLKFLWNHKLFWGISILWLWSLITSITAVNHLIAIKYILAKIWYITSFLIFTFWAIRTKDDIKALFWTLYIPIMMTAVYSFINTAIGGFNFENTNKFSLPFYDNHVIYATTMTLLLPLVFIARSWYGKGTVVYFILQLSIPFLLIAIYFSYTRACYLALIVGLTMFIVLKFRKLIVTYSLAVMAVIGVLFFFSKDYFYLRLAPDYNTTVMHNEFKDHLISTFYGKDASSMERLNMWVSVFRMYQESPWVGYGPNNFPSTYKPYMVMYFKTWVSDNPLNLSCHNYFWLLLAEQGVVGVLLFVLFIGFILYYLQKIYHSTQDKSLKSFTGGILVCIGIFIVILFFNDLVETSKNGSIFFILIALLIRIHQLSIQEKN